jgi:hypothetical protein
MSRKRWLAQYRSDSTASFALAALETSTLGVAYRPKSARCGGARYSPTTSVTLATSSASVENSKVSECYGATPYLRHSA